MFTDQAVAPNRSNAAAQGRRVAAAPGVRALPEGGPQDLTAREREVLELAGQGLSNKGIAQALGISSGTVTWHLKNCYQKYGVGSREQALRQARQQSQIRPVGTAVCTCGRVHTLWGPAPADGSRKEREQE